MDANKIVDYVKKTPEISGLSESGTIDGNFAMVLYNEEINSVTFSGGNMPK